MLVKEVTMVMLIMVDCSNESYHVNDTNGNGSNESDHVKFSNGE
jgi:hypothetical protein